MTLTLPNNLNRDEGTEEPTRISWSGLKRWEECRQLQLRTIQGASPRTDGRIFLPGTIVDRVQTKWLNLDDPQPGQMREMIADVFREHTGPDAEYNIKWKSKTDKREVLELCVEAVTRLEPILQQRVLPFDYEPAKRFRAHMMLPFVREGVRAPVTMIGEADVITRDEHLDFGIYDLKITKDPGYIKKTLAQLTFYAIAWALIQGDMNQPVRFGFIAPMISDNPEDQFIPVEVTKEDRTVMMSRIIKYVQGVWDDEWAPKSDDVGCRWCDVRGVCEKFKTIAIVDEHGKQKSSFAAAAAQRAAFRRTDEA